MKKLESTKKILLNSILRVYKKGFGYSRITVIANNDYYIGALADNDLFNNIKENDKVEAYLWVEDVASYDFEIEMIGRISADPKILFFRHTDKIIRNKGRKCLGAKTDIPIKFFIFNPNEIDKSISSKKVTFYDGKIVWLEDREAIINCLDILPTNVFLRGHIKIDDDDLELVGCIESIDNKKFYNIIYNGIDDKDRNRILEYIFNIYRE